MNYIFIVPKTCMFDHCAEVLAKHKSNENYDIFNLSTYNNVINSSKYLD